MANLIENKNIIYELVRKNVKTQYRSSFLGMFWTILNPLLNMVVMWIIFNQFFGRDDPNYVTYLLCGNIMFACLRSATDGALTSIVNNRGLLSKIKIDPYLFPMASILSSFVNFLFSLVSLFIIMLCVQIFGGLSLFSFRILAVLLMIPAFVLFEYGIGLFLSAIYVFCRDIKYLYSVLLTLWMYLTPVFWKFESLTVGSLAYKIVKLNPMYYFLKYFRQCMYLGWSEFPIGNILFLFLIGVISFLIGFGTFKLLKKKFMTFI